MGMTLDEAIKYAENMAALSHRGSGNAECEQNHRQLAEWLKDYKRLKEQEPCEDCISRQAALGCCRNEWEEEVEIRLKSLPSVTPQQSCEDIAKAFQFGMALGFGEKHDEMDKVIDEIKKVITPQPKMGRWKRISIDKYSEHAKYWYRCDRCGKDNLGDTNFCPSCGCRMVESQEGEE